MTTDAQMRKLIREREWLSSLSKAGFSWARLIAGEELTKFDALHPEVLARINAGH